LLPKYLWIGYSIFLIFWWDGLPRGVTADFHLLQKGLIWAGRDEIFPSPLHSQSTKQTVGVKGDEAELRNASDEFGGHCLALTLLGSYLTDAYNGDIRCRKEVSEHLGHDVRQGVHARNVMESYQSWFGEGSELSILRMLGLFDRPVEEKALDALLASPAILDALPKGGCMTMARGRVNKCRLARANG
jgi:hypothetical protein